MDRKNPKIANLEHLPKPIKDGLELIQDLVVEMFQPEMIILMLSAIPLEFFHASEMKNAT